MAIFDSLGSKVNKLKVDKSISDIVNKKLSIERAAQSDISLLTSKITNEYCKIGETVYMQNEINSFDSSVLQESLEEIGKLKEIIKDKHVKLSEIIARYDEELDILKSSIEVYEDAPNLGDNQKHCSKCGATYVFGEDLFCEKCGNKL